MKVTDLMAVLQRMRDPEADVVVTLKQSNVGGTSCSSVTTASGGIDWDNGKVLLGTENPVVTQEHLDRIQNYSRAYEKLLYFYALENNLEFMGKPLMGSAMCPKGSSVRTFKEYMKRDVSKYLGNGE
jgi:hypothetical protein